MSHCNITQQQQKPDTYQSMQQRKQKIKQLFVALFCSYCGFKKKIILKKLDTKMIGSQSCDGVKMV